jgi:hypothetical protein
MADEQKKKNNPSQDKPANAKKTDLQKKGSPAPDKAEGERDSEDAEEE